MKNSFHFLLASLLALLTACTVDEIPKPASENAPYIFFTPFFSPDAEPLIDGYDALVVLEIGNPHGEKEGGKKNTSVRFYANFAEKGQKIYAGEVTVDGDIPLSFVEDLEHNNSRYLFDSTFLGQVRFSGEYVPIELQSATASYESFVDSVYVPIQSFPLTSIPERSDYFSKSQDFEVTWVDDPNIEKAYLVICNPGVPCIFKEVPDNGYLKVDKSEFADFQVGTEVFFRFGRGDYHCFYQGSGADQKKICLVSMGVSNLTGFLEVVE